MSFLYWVCNTYFSKRQKKGKRKSVNQYWRDFKMLFCRANGEHVNTNDSAEVVKVLHFLADSLPAILILSQYINTKLRVLFELDMSAKPKPVTGPDNLLLLLVQHWACDESIFPTEDDRLNLPTIMLFQSYTGCRPAELVHAPQGRGLQDPLDGDDIHNAKVYPDFEAYDDKSDYGDDNNDSGYNSDTEGDGRDVVDNVIDLKDGDFIGDSNDDGNCKYDSDRTDSIATKDTADCYMSEVDDLGALVRSSAVEQQTQDPDEFREPVREFKALCYKDVCLWVVKDPKRGGRDLLAMEVNLCHHKGVDNKPKPCVDLSLLALC